MYDYFALVDTIDSEGDQEGAVNINCFRTRQVGDPRRIEDTADVSETQYFLLLGSGEELLNQRDMFRKFTPRQGPHFYEEFVLDIRTKKIRELKWTDKVMNETLKAMAEPILRASDWIFLEDSPVSGEEKEAWREFRHEIRNITKRPRAQKLEMLRRNIDEWPIPPDYEMVFQEFPAPNPFTEFGRNMVDQVEIFGEAERDD